MDQRSLEAVIQSPEAERFPRTYYLLGTIWAQSGELGKAVFYYHHYLQLEPNSKAADAVREQLDWWTKEGLITLFNWRSIHEGRSHRS